jgi:hypothetical protein
MGARQAFDEKVPPHDQERKRAIWRRARAKYRETHPSRCARCASTALRGRSCAWCLAVFAERRTPGLDHDTRHHAVMFALTANPSARCAASGLSLAQLSTLGERLEVDRIDPHRGYVRGNCQLLARSLNRSKGRTDAPAEWRVDELRALANGKPRPRDW